MFGDMEGITRAGITKVEEEMGIIEVFVEERSLDWWVTYAVYEDKVEVTESMGDNYNHCEATCKTLDEAIAVASQWC